MRGLVFTLGMPLWLRTVFAWTVCLMATMGTTPASAQAQNLLSQASRQEFQPETPISIPPAAAPNSTKPIPEQGFSNYSVGMRVQFGPEGISGKPRPILGFRYGRWNIGTNSDPEAWLAFSGVGKEPSVAYELSTKERISAFVSVRVHNLSTGSSFDVFDSGRHTLRGRVAANYKIDRHWTIGTEATLDLLGKGDGSTLSLGLARSFRVGERGQLTPSAGLTGGNGQHWRSANAGNPLASNLHAGLGSAGIGLGYRYAFNPKWAWYGSLGASRPLGQLAQIGPVSWGWGGQAGLQYFGKF
jgi:outer membrane protein